MNPIEEPAFAGDYVSTTIPYVNAPPHVGFALEVTQADALVRALRLLGRSVHASTGTDDHSLKNVRAAAAQRVPLRALLSKNAEAFGALNRALGAHFDDVVRTSSDPRHPASVARLFRALESAGDLYKSRYSGAYCVGCESFLSSDELVGGACAEHGLPPELVSEENWFFRLSSYEAPLLNAIRSGRLRILPEERKNEVIGFIQQGLRDFSVSRSATRAHGFGVPVPGDPDQVVYVWVDALANYLTTFDYGGRERSGFQSAARRVHVLGKGVLRFHAVYWPALLLSAGLPLPDELRVHGYLTVEGRKIGKSLGNALDPLVLCADYGATALRYYLLRHVPAFKDADFSRQRLIEAHDAELAGELGNLARRVLSLLERHRENRVPSPGPVGTPENELERLAAALPAHVASSVARHELGAALDGIWELVRTANRYVDASEPWRLARLGASAAPRLDTVFATLVGVLRVLAVALAPFVPELAERLAAHVLVKLEPGALRKLSIFDGLPVGGELVPCPILAPRLRPHVNFAPEAGSS